MSEVEEFIDWICLCCDLGLDKHFNMEALQEEALRLVVNHDI